MLHFFFEVGFVERLRTIIFLTVVERSLNNLNLEKMEFMFDQINEISHLTL